MATVFHGVKVLPFLAEGWAVANSAATLSSAATLWLCLFIASVPLGILSSLLAEKLSNAWARWDGTISQGPQAAPQSLMPFDLSAPVLTPSKSAKDIIITFEESVVKTTLEADSVIAPEAQIPANPPTVGMENLPSQQPGSAPNYSS